MSGKQSLVGHLSSRQLEGGGDGEGGGEGAQAVVHPDEGKVVDSHERNKQPPEMVDLGELFKSYLPLTSYINFLAIFFFFDDVL